MTVVIGRVGKVNVVSLSTVCPIMPPNEGESWLSLQPQDVVHSGATYGLVLVGSQQRVRIYAN